MDEDDLIRSELERLAQAYLTADAAADSASSSSSSPSSPKHLIGDVDVSPALAKSLAQVQVSNVIGSSLGKGHEQTALVSVPAALPADFLFRLEPPVDTAQKLEKSLALPQDSLKTITANRTGDEGEGIQTVLFVFITDELQSKIMRWIKDDQIDISPLFVKLAKTT